MIAYGARTSALQNAFWLPLFFQDTALPAIAIPASIVLLAPRDHVRALAVVVALMSLVSMVVPPIAGAISDALTRRGVQRRAAIWVGAALDVSSLIMLSRVHTLGSFILFLLLATAGANISLAAYQALIPDVVPKAAWGTASGVRSVAMLLGTILGFGVAAGTPPATTFIGVAVAIGAGALVLFTQRERTTREPEDPAHVSDWHDFTVVFVARAFLAFGLALLMTFVLYFFRDILRIGNPSAGTALVGIASLAGAIFSGLYLGWLSDRVPRKLVVALCGIPMTVAAAGFAIAPEPHWMYAYALLFGIGFGGVTSTGWALAIDSVPKLRDVGRDLGIWGIAQNFPQVLAPLAGGWVLAAYGNSEAGYRVLFFGAAASFAAGSLTVLGVGKRPIVPWWGNPLRIAAALAMLGYLRSAYRIRSWGSLPRKRGPALIISNHQIDLDLMEPIAKFVLTGGPRTPVLTASAKLMYEPGFLAIRVPWLWRFFHNVNLGWLFSALGLLPLENELQSRSIARWAWSVQRRHGVLPLDGIFKPSALPDEWKRGTTTRDLFRAQHFRRASVTPVRLSDLQVRYRKEALDDMRLGVEADLARIEDCLDRGATFLVTPEGDYPTDGAMLPFRGIWDRLRPHAREIFLGAISYDPFVGSRLSQLYLVAPLRDPQTVIEELQAARPVTTTALLSHWLSRHGERFTESDAIAGVAALLNSLPPQLFVDPELRADPRKLTRRALQNLRACNVVVDDGSEWRLSEHRVHPRFAQAADVIAYQARFFAQTLEGNERAGRVLREQRPSVFEALIPSV